ncbi:beta-ketothiolase BktB [Emcibacter sp.]|uniref:beta-ketothiolase BktB n=1 Tax=Emcibacter sp. TaxID=1979954 RepID=UPI002AA61727|nr:beta-ketothiolase BktB [Emcibacter sp.]
MSEIKEVVIVGAARTAIGGFGGSLKSLNSAQLGTIAAREAIQRANVEAGMIQSCIVGNVIRNSPKDSYLARVIGIDSGLSPDSHAVTVNRLCGSGLEAIVQAAQQIQLGEVNTALAGGAESMSNSSYSLASNRWGQRMGNSTILDDLTTTLQDPWDDYHMGITAENVAEKYGISREEQDAFTAESHRRAAAAIDAGHFREQIVPVELKSRKGVTVFDTDEHVRGDTTAEGLSALKPFFKKDGTVTAATSSGINDGAAMVVLMEAGKAEKEGRSPLGRLVGFAHAGVEPHLMGEGPIPAVRKVFARTGLNLDDIDVIESNEAFAAQALAVSRELGLPADKVNPNGGAVALGHPVGATGGILTTKVLYELKRTGGRYGLVTMCIGGGQGIAAIFERL